MKKVSGFTRNTLFVAVFAVIAVVIVARMASQSTDVVSIPSAASTMQPSKDGFGFPNFPAALSFEQFNTGDMVRIAGAEACVNGDEKNCQLTAQANAWAQMVNQARETGHCEGFAVTSASRYLESSTPQTAELTNTGDTTHAIFRSFASQFFPEVRDESDEWVSASLREKLAAIATEIAKGSLTYTLGLYTKTGGHAVLPYAVEKIDPQHFIIRVYDSNWPGKNRFVSVDLAKNEWSFSFSHQDPNSDKTPWTGGPHDMDIASLNTRTNSSSPVGTGAVNGSVLLIRSKSDDWSIETSQGTVSSTAKSVLKPKPLHTDKSRQIPEYIVRAPSGALKLKMPSKASVFVVSKRKIVRLTTKGSPVPIGVSDSQVTTIDNEVTVSVASANLAITVVNAASEISLSDQTISAQVVGREGPVTVTDDTPRLTITATESGVQVAAGSEVDTVKADLPEELREPTQLPDLPPAESRDMSVPGYQVDVYRPASDVIVVTPKPETVTNTVAPFIEGTTTSTSTSTVVLNSSTTSTTTTTTTTSTSSTTSTTTTTIMPAVRTGTTTTLPVITTTTTLPNSSVVTTTTTTSTTTTTTSTTTTTTTTTTTVPLTCATGGVCALGDVGPGGGKVFYIAPVGSPLSWKYMEVAPANAATAIKWCNNSTSLVAGAFSRDIGTGAANTTLILADGTCATGSAAAAADSYVSPNGTSDWFLPSILELHQMYPIKSLVGMPSSRNFWSSSQNSNVYAEAQSYLDGGNPSWWKTNFIDYDVRAVRTFGTP